MRTTASFRLFGSAELPASRVTAHLGIEPSRSHEVGDPVSSRSSATRKSSLWLLSSGEIAEGELDVCILQLLDVLEPLRPRLWQLVDAGYRANWFCYVHSSATEHAVELDRDLLARLLTLPGGLWLDVG